MAFELPSESVADSATLGGSGALLGAAKNNPATDMIKKLVMSQMMGGQSGYAPAQQRGGMRAQGSGLGGLLGKGVGMLGGLAALNMMKPKAPVPGQLATGPSIPANENMRPDGSYVES